jgi:hypothetical protein
MFDSTPCIRVSAQVRVVLGSPRNEEGTCSIVLATALVSPQLWDSTLTFYVNGAEVNIVNPDPNMHLVDYLRNVAQLKGTKV